MVESSPKGRMTTSMIILAIVAALGLAAVTFIVVPQVEVTGLPVLLHYTCFDNPSPDSVRHPCGPPLRD